MRSRAYLNLIDEASDSGDMLILKPTKLIEIILTISITLKYESKI